MRELTVQVSDNQFDLLVSFLKTLPYVKLPKDIKASPVTDTQMVAENTSLYQRTPSLSIEDLGLMDNKSWDMEYIKKHHAIQWQHLDELRELFKGAPFDTMLEDLSK